MIVEKPPVGYDREIIILLRFQRTTSLFVTNGLLFIAFNIRISKLPIRAIRIVLNIAMENYQRPVVNRVL
jgi:hypothetical protein